MEINIKNTNFCGMARSGNHAIIFWFLHNLFDSYEEIAPQAYASYDSSICFLNNCNVIGHKNVEINHYKTIVRSYEDIWPKENIDIYILRDFLNLISSRHKAFGLYMGPISKKDGAVNYGRPDPSINLVWDAKYLDRFIKFKNIWKSHAKRQHKHIIYNNWVINKTYRDWVSIKKLNVPNTKDNIEYISKIGGGSSFSNFDTIKDKQNYNNRFKTYQLPEIFIKHILNDKELVMLNKKIFNIDIEKEIQFLRKR